MSEQEPLRAVLCPVCEEVAVFQRPEEPGAGAAQLCKACMEILEEEAVEAATPTTRFRVEEGDE